MCARCLNGVSPRRDSRVACPSPPQAGAGMRWRRRRGCVPRSMAALRLAMPPGAEGRSPLTRGIKAVRFLHSYSCILNSVYAFHRPSLS